MDYKITPKGLILGLIQASSSREITIKALILIGEMFGFTGNAIRVSVNRLIREGKLESNERGIYQLSEKVGPYSRYIEAWRLGEDRTIPWDGSWICYLSPILTSRKQERNRSILSKPGFREGKFNLWVRPNNLKIGLVGICRILDQMGPVEKGELFVGNSFDARLSQQWEKFLWPIGEMIRNQQKFLIKLEKSAARLLKMPTENALVESFLVGSEAIYLLISDPLLPVEMMDNTHRKALTEALLEYDTLGKGIWAERFGQLGFRNSPANNDYLDTTFRNNFKKMEAGHAP